MLAGGGNRNFHSQQRKVHDYCGQRCITLDRRGADSKTVEKHEGLREAKGAEDHSDQRKKEGIRNSNSHHLGIHHRPGCVLVRISVVFVPGVGRSIFSSIEAMQSGVRTILGTGKLHLQFARNTSLPLT